MSTESPKRFRVALSFSGQDRLYVEQVAHTLGDALSRDRIFYDRWHQAELARSNLDTYLLNIYRRECDLVVVFLSSAYAEAEWGGLEWRAVRELIKTRDPADVMLVRIGPSEIAGLFSIDGYVDAQHHSPTEIGELILQRFTLHTPLDLEIRLAGSLSEFTADKEAAVLEAICAFLRARYKISIKAIEQGSVRITIELDAVDALAVFNALRENRLDIAGVLSVAVRANIRDTSAIPAESQFSFDVFLCHNSDDKPEVRKIANLLRARGINPWLDEEQLRPGLPWQEALEENIQKIQAAAVFIGHSGLGPWQNAEMRAFLNNFVERRIPIIPVILETADREPELPIFLRSVTWVDFRRQAPDPLDRLLWGITGKRTDG